MFVYPQLDKIINVLSTNFVYMGIHYCGKVYQSLINVSDVNYYYKLTTKLITTKNLLKTNDEQLIHITNSTYCYYYEFIYIKY